MTDIALLMTGVLKTGQPPLPILAEQPLVQLDSEVEKETRSQLFQIVPTAQITPPEFMQLDEASPTALSPRTENDNQKLLEYLVASENSADVNSRFPRRSLSGKRVGYQSIAATSQRYLSQSLPTLRFGTSGVPVRVLQKLLLSNGYILEVDGAFGALTEIAVKAFQNKRNLAVDGVVGENTWYELTK